uniref:Uncharacterized protein n=1 Tax=Magallana gigas TaxID=29159 RepID=A0A8W8JBS7_MAGGI
MAQSERNLLLIICSIVIILTENCHISPHVDECGNVGLLWNCSGLNLYRLPILLPPELKNQNREIWSLLTLNLLERICFTKNGLFVCLLLQAVYLLPFHKTVKFHHISMIVETWDYYGIAADPI